MHVVKIGLATWQTIILYQHDCHGLRRPHTTCACTQLSTGMHDLDLQQYVFADTVRFFST